jgi:hypothetical protein
MKASLRKQLSFLVQRRINAERRRNKRVVPVRRTLCLLRCSAPDEQTTAIVQNFSRSGIAVQAEQNYEPGTLLHILLVNDAHTFSLAVDMNVVRSSRVGDQYLIAGPFARPLLHEEMVPFIV